MKRFGVLMGLCMTSAFTYANVAVDELNALLLKKDNAQVEMVHDSRSSPMINNLSTNYDFIFIYKGSCPHCHQFAPVLKDFSDTFHVKVTSYSMDESSIDDFEGKPLSPELFQTLFVTGHYKPAVPALFLVNKHTLEAYAVLFGEATPYQFARRVNELMQHIEEKYNEH